MRIRRHTWHFSLREKHLHDEMTAPVPRRTAISNTKIRQARRVRKVNRGRRSWVHSFRTMLPCSTLYPGMKTKHEDTETMQTQSPLPSLANYAQMPPQRLCSQPRNLMTSTKEDFTAQVNVFTNSSLISPPRQAYSVIPEPL